MHRRSFLKMLPLSLSVNMLGQYTEAETNMFTGFHMPDEAAPHHRTFMQWPVNRTVYPDRYFLQMVQRSIADIANTISEYEPVVMLMEQKYIAKARRKLSAQIEIWDIPTDDLWCRDSGPMFVQNPAGNLAIANLNFNGWGGKQVHGNDGKIAARVAECLDLPLLDTGVVGEAGGLESSGHGTLIAHESSWINPNRNVAGKAEITQRLLNAYGADKMIWAPGITDADITDYHIDSLARFVTPAKVLIQLPEHFNKHDPWAKAAYETHDILSNATNAAGHKLEIITIPDPTAPRITSADFVASYVNYYVCNGAVICAEFGDAKTDEIAITTLRDLYPDHEVIALNIDPIGEVGGGIHCATQQQPRA